MSKLARSAISAAAFFVVFALLDLLLNRQVNLGNAFFVTMLYLIFSLLIGAIVKKVKSRRTEL